MFSTATKARHLGIRTVSSVGPVVTRSSRLTWIYVQGPSRFGRSTILRSGVSSRWRNWTLQLRCAVSTGKHITSFRLGQPRSTYHSLLSWRVAWILGDFSCERSKFLIVISLATESLL